VVRRFLQVATVAAVAISLTPVVLAQGGEGCAGCRRPAAGAALQGGPRDPFGHDDLRKQQDGGGGITALGGTAAGGRSASAPGATAAQALPRTGSTTSALAVVAGALLAAGGLALWVTRYRPRHAGSRPRYAGDRPRHAGYRPRHAR
jgi:LPXTG-motif cell wall-anchored protein